jgi:hypothetical protein
MMNFRKIGVITALAIVTGFILVFPISISAQAPAVAVTIAPIQLAPFGMALNVSNFLTNLVRLLFFIAGLVAIIFMLLGGFEWITAGGKEDDIKNARAKITGSAIGLVVMVAVLFLGAILEIVVFNQKICLGISCPIDFNAVRLF